MALPNYTKASPAEHCDKEWYHGEMTKDKAERQLSACGNNCFLVRESKGALILSLLLSGEAHHFNIEHGPGSYKLQASSSQEKFSELTELVAHCSSNAIKIILGVACKKSHTTRDGAALVEEKNMEAGDKDTPGHYTKGEPADLTKYHWYHGEMTEEEAEQVIESYRDPKNRFLVRQSAKHLVLSKKIDGWISHTTITSNPEGYCLEGRSDLFKSIPEMITRYLMFPIEKTQLLGTACGRESSRSLTDPVPDYNRQVFREKNSQFTVSWRSCADLPKAMSVPQVVKIGDYVYVGGGMMKQGANNYIQIHCKNDWVKKKYPFWLFELQTSKHSTTQITKNGWFLPIHFCSVYNPSEDTWTPLPYCPTHLHGLATWNGELLAIGGKEGYDIVNAIYTFAKDMWKEVLPPMPTPRYLLSATSHDNRLIIAAGGIVHQHSDGERILTDIVEVYKKEQWHTTKRLPFPTSSFLTSIIGEKCYILGGTDELQDTTLYTTLSSLLDDTEPADSVYSMPQVPITWKKLQGKYPLLCPSNIVKVKGMLTTVGGADESGKGTIFVSTYNFHTDTWVECKGAELPVALFRSSVVKLNDNEVMVIGGEPKQRQFSAKVLVGIFNIL